MTPERLESAQRIVETVIHEQMSDIAFHRILVTYDSEAYGYDDYVEVTAVYEGEREQLRPRRSLELLTTLRRRLYDEGITEFPLLYMTRRADWDKHPDPA